MKHHLKIAASIACILSGPAMAQVSTNCIGNAGFVHCDSYDSGAAAAANAEAGREIGQAIAMMKEKSLRAKLGKMVAAGDCQGAATYALQKGRFDMVEGLKQFCGAGGAQVREVAPLASSAPSAPLSPYEAGRAAAKAATASAGG
jgi:hypothetical protein